LTCTSLRCGYIGRSLVQWNRKHSLMERKFLYLSRRSSAFEGGPVLDFLTFSRSSCCLLSKSSSFAFLLLRMLLIRSLKNCSCSYIFHQVTGKMVRKSNNNKKHINNYMKFKTRSPLGRMWIAIQLGKINTRILIHQKR